MQIHIIKHIMVMVLNLICVQKFSLPDGGVGKNVIIYGVDMSLLLHIDNKKKDILILGITSKEKLDGTMLPAEPQFSINFSR